MGYMPPGRCETGQYRYYTVIFPAGGKMNRNFRIALLLSLGLHIFMMSAVVIINPAANRKIRNYTKVDFLGPLLKKTAFDIMLESSAPGFETRYSFGMADQQQGYLKVRRSKRRFSTEKFPEYGVAVADGTRYDELALADKSTPEYMLIKSAKPVYGDTQGAKRKVLYKPEFPGALAKKDGSEGAASIRAKVLVSGNGTVKDVVLLTTSGYPVQDIQALKYIRGWIFEPVVGAEDEWEEVEVAHEEGFTGI